LVIDLALEAKKKNEKKIIAFNFSGHGLLDLNGYAQFLDGKMA
jgi:tryptophan synthase beta chain